MTENDHPVGINGYVSPAIPERGIHSVFYKDGPAGVGATSWPAEMLLACSFDEEALYRMGDAIGGECEESQVDVWLAPALNLHRHPLGGRNFEYYSEDPFLAGSLGAAVLRGVQENHKVLVCAKHFAANEQETYRRGSAKQDNGLPAFDAVDSLVTERALRELYLKPFQMAVEAGLHCVMTSFNKINGTFAGGSKDLCTHILREEWGFDGAVVTDWGDMDIVVDGAGRRGCRQRCGHARRSAGHRPDFEGPGRGQGHPGGNGSRCGAFAVHGGALGPVPWIVPALDRPRFTRKEKALDPSVGSQGFFRRQVQPLFLTPRSRRGARRP